MFLSGTLKPSQKELDAIDELLPLVDNWNYFLDLLIDRGAAPLFYVKLPLLQKKNIIPQNIQDILMQTYYKVMSRNMVLYKALNEVIEILDSNKIKVVVLKGMYVAEHFYKDIALRQSSDIDLLVEEKNGLKTLELIKTLGFQNISTEISEFIGGETYKIHYSPLVRNGVLVEVHHHLHKKNSRYAFQIQDMIDNSELVTLAGREVFALNIYDILIHTCVHIDKHFEEGYVQFTGYFDVTNILASYGDTFDWEKLIERCRFHQCEQAVFKQIIIAEKYFCTIIPEQIKNRYSDTLNDDDENLLLTLLSGDTSDIKVGVHKYYTNQHLTNIKSLKTIKKKLRYLKDVTFPAKQFMIDKYCPQAPNRYWRYYFYRYYRGIKGLLK